MIVTPSRGPRQKIWGPYMFSVRTPSKILQYGQKVPMYATDVLFYGFTSVKFVRVKKTKT